MLNEFFNLKNDNDPDKTSKYQEMGNYLGLGLQLTVTVIVMVFLGIWLDEKFNTNPWLTVICSMFGIFAAMYTFIKSVLKSDK